MNTSPSGTGALTEEELAEHLQLTTQVVLNCASDTAGHLRLGRRVRYTPADLSARSNECIG